MSSFLTNKSNTRYEVFKDGIQLFDSKFIQIVLHSGLIIFVRDLFTESIVLTPGTSIKLETGMTKINFAADLTGTVYEIEAQHVSTTRALYNDILIAAGQKECKMVDEVNGIVTSTILPPIQQLSHLLANSLTEVTRNIAQTGGGGRPGNSGNGSSDTGSCGPPTNLGDFSLGGGYHSTFDNGKYSVRFGRNQEQMDFQEFEIDDVNQGPSDFYPGLNQDAGNHPRKRHGPGGGGGGGGGPSYDYDTFCDGPSSFVSRAPLKRSKFYDEYSRQLFVGNLPQTITESELADIFSSFGEIEKIHIIPNESLSTPYIAFVLYDFETSAQRAVKSKANISLKMLDGSERRLNVQSVKPKPWRPPKS